VIKTKRNQLYFSLALTILLFVMAACLLMLRMDLKRIESNLERFKTETYERESRILSANMPTFFDETPLEIVDSINNEVNEAEIAEITEIGALTLDPDEEDMGYTPHPYDEDYVLRVLTAEAGSDEVLCGCVAQALYNACEKHGWAYTPEEIMWKYSYTSPASWISDAAVKAYDDVFLSGVTYTDIGNAIYFYAPRYCDSPWHESQKYVCTVSEVRFFEEWD